jgi:hypothetical protein
MTGLPAAPALPPERRPAIPVIPQAPRVSPSAALGSASWGCGAPRGRCRYPLSREHAAGHSSCRHGAGHLQHYPARRRLRSPRQPAAERPDLRQPPRPARAAPVHEGRAVARATRHGAARTLLMASIRRAYFSREPLPHSDRPQGARSSRCGTSRIRKLCRGAFDPFR